MVDDRFSDEVIEAMDKRSAHLARKVAGDLAIPLEDIEKKEIMGFWKGIKEAVSHRWAANSAKSFLKNAQKTSEKLPKYQGEKLVDPLKEAAADVGDKFMAYKDAVAAGVGVSGARESLSFSREAAAEVLKDAKRHISGIKSFASGKFIGRVLSSKLFLIPAAIVAAAVVVAKLIFGGKGDKAEETENKRQSTQALRSEVEALRGADTLWGEQKVTDGAHVQRVMAGRNGGAAMGVDTSNPAISMNYDIVH